jgi:beta-glucosidase
MKNYFKSLAAAVTILLLLSSCNGGRSVTQPILGTRSAQIIEVKKLQFKDLNGNGELDPYEDWRLTPEKRSKDLLSKMSLEEKAGFMMINSLNMLGTRNAELSGGLYSPSDLEEGQVSRNQQPQGNIQGGFIGNMNASSSTTGRVKDFYNRHFILRSNESARVIAEWNNKLQELCESEPLGIPAIIASNPRNHITVNASVGTSLDATVFTAWPGELGLSASRDLELIRDFADISRQEWLAAGIRKGYMYMADLATEPRWSRVDGTFGESPEWVADVIREVVLGFQGDKLSSTSIALTTKHFPGGGSGKDGQDSHFEWGKEQIFPGGRFYDNLLPFRAAVDAGTSAIMPYYSLPSGTEFEEVGYAYNKRVLEEVLRGQLGFKGIVNTDTGPLERMPWGVEDLTLHERYKKALEAGSNIFSGVSDPSDLLEVINSGMVDMALIDNSVLLLLKEKFELGLFENPYVDPDKAEQIVNNESFRERAGVAMRKSIVLLRNENNVLPAKERTKIYFESFQASSGRGSGEKQKNIFMDNNGIYDVELVDKPEAADMIVLWLIPSGNALFESQGGPISLSLSKNNINVDYINSVAGEKPTVLVVNYTNPWVINEIYNDENPGNIKSVMATFGTTHEALLDVITGKFNPTGKMPFSTPISDEAVENQLEDVPGYLEPEGYALFNFDEGMSY